MKRFKVTLEVGVSAKNPKEARELVKAMMTDGLYKGKYLKFTPNGSWGEMKVEELLF
jgi:hypothetical protein